MRDSMPDDGFEIFYKREFLYHNYGALMKKVNSKAILDREFSALTPVKRERWSCRGHFSTRRRCMAAMKTYKSDQAVYIFICEVRIQDHNARLMSAHERREQL